MKKSRSGRCWRRRQIFSRSSNGRDTWTHSGELESSCDTENAVTPPKRRLSRSSSPHLLTMPFQRATHDVRLTRDDGQVGAGGGVRLEASLLPIAQCAHRNVIAGREFLLRKAEHAP